MVDIDEVRELRKELNEFQLETVGRLATIETQLKTLVDAQKPPRGGHSPGGDAVLGKVTLGILEVLKVAVAALTAWVVSKAAGGGTP